uniref:Uncharacterized protein n=1 Tax=Timema shepardi TaxID=629360 RepID=A0A7R9B5X0_TIMSH|nr:unnamed protein product [Timema shepardi]
MASLVLNDSFKKLPDQITYPYAEPDDLQKHVLAAVTSDTQNVASYIIPCARDDPQLNACALKNARKALPHFINGDKKYNVPPLEPFKIPELRVNPDGLLRLVLSSPSSDTSVAQCRRTQAGKRSAAKPS